MEDATKTWPYLKPGVGNKTDSNPEETPGAGAHDTPQPQQPSTGQKALDRWFLEDRGGKRVPKRLQIPNEVLVTSGGPLKMTGNLTLINEDGSIMHANRLDFCRCGNTQTRPLCDNRHLDHEFLDRGAIYNASDCLPSNRPQTITVTAVKDGPLKFRGYLRIYNRKGQECTTMEGSLCRCGRSAKKPFCDCM